MSTYQGETKKLSARMIVSDKNEEGIIIIHVDANGHPLNSIRLTAEEAVNLKNWLA